MLALAPALLNLPAYPIRITFSDGVGESSDAKARPTLLAAFANTPYFGDGMRIAPQADMTDGKLDLCRISSMNPAKLVYMFPTVYFGRHVGSPEVEYRKVERARVESDVPLEIYADGEYVCETPAEVGVASAALKVIA